MLSDFHSLPGLTPYANFDLRCPSPQSVDVCAAVCLQAVSDFAKAINWKVIFNVNEYYPYPDPVVDPDQVCYQMLPNDTLLSI